jgi:hypothetical protein
VRNEPASALNTKSVRKLVVLDLEQTADSANIFGLKWSPFSSGLMLPTGSQSPSEVRALRMLEKGLLDKMRHLY